MWCWVQNVCWDILQPPTAWGAIENKWMVPAPTTEISLNNSLLRSVTQQPLPTFSARLLSAWRESYRPLSSPVLHLYYMHYIWFAEPYVHQRFSCLRGEREAAESKGMINPQVPSLFSVCCLCETELPLLFTVSMALRTAAYSDSTLHSFSCLLLCHRGEKTFLGN